MTKSKLLAGLSLAAGLAVLATSVTVAQDPISKRRDFMKGSVGPGAKASGEMIKGEKPYDAAAAAAAASKIASGWEEFAKNFPKGSETGGETRAAPKIWETFSDFDEKGKALAKAAGVAAAEAPKGLDAFKAAWGEVGKTCKGCHDLYLLPKK